MGTDDYTLFDHLPILGLADVPAAAERLCLRDYQCDATAAALAELRAGRNTLLVMPTGTGKTETFIAVLRTWLLEHPGQRAMVLAHRAELVDQAALRIAGALGEMASIEMAERWAGVGRHSCRVIVGSVQTQVSGTVGSERMRRFNPMDFQLLIIDETHHAAAASYRRVAEYYSSNVGLRILGATATPWRKDKKRLAGLYDSYAYVRTLPWAVSAGWLVPLWFEPIRILDVSYDGITARSGDLPAGRLDAILREERTVQAMAAPIHERMDWRQTIVFCAGKDQAHSMVRVLNRRALACARLVLEDTPREERRATIADFRAGRFPYLVNVGIATEGFDVPNVSGIAMCRPTLSTALYLQMLGRGVRPLAGVVDGPESADERKFAIAISGKPRLSVIDFVSNTRKHQLVGAAEVMQAGRDGPHDVAVAQRVRQVTENAAEAGEGFDPHEIWDREEQRLREDEEERRRSGIVAMVRFSVAGHDPLCELPLEQDGAGDGLADTEGALISPAQLARLKQWKFADVEQLTRTSASRLIAAEKRRLDAGLASHAMVQQLKKRGIEGADSWTKKRADVARDILIEFAWRPRGKRFKRLLYYAGVFDALDPTDMLEADHAKSNF